jgi:hypothetical protein
VELGPATGQARAATRDGEETDVRHVKKQSAWVRWIFLELACSGFLRNGFALMFSNQMCIKWNGAAPFHQMPPNTYLNGS